MKPLLTAMREGRLYLDGGMEDARRLIEAVVTA